MPTYFKGGTFEEQQKQMEPILSLLNTYRDIPSGLLQGFVSGGKSLEETVAAITKTPIFNPNIGPLIDTGGGFKTQSGAGATFNPVTNRYELTGEQGPALGF